MEPGGAGARLVAFVDHATDRWQWPALAFATVLVAARVVLEGAGQRTPLIVLAFVGLLFGVFGLVCGARRSFDNSQARVVHDSWKALPRRDRATVRRAIRERTAIPQRLIGPAKALARWRIENTPSLGWVFAGLAAGQVGNRLDVSLWLSIVAILMGAAFTIVMNRVRSNSRQVLAQPDPVH